LMVKSRCVLQFSPHFLLNTSNVARLPHMGLKKKNSTSASNPFFSWRYQKNSTKIPFMIFISNGPYITKSHQGCFPTGASPRSSSAGGAQSRRGKMGWKRIGHGVIWLWINTY
jgi:hypothetical protein